jgi:hypothetical protein
MALSASSHTFLRKASSGRPLSTPFVTDRSRKESTLCGHRDPARRMTPFGPERKFTHETARGQGHRLR